MRLNRNIGFICLFILCFLWLQGGSIHDLVSEGDIEKVKKWVEKHPLLVSQKMRNGTTPLHVACTYNKIDIALYLISKGADINAANRWGGTPLHFACRRGNGEIVKLLLEKGANVNAVNDDRRTPLYHAARNGYVDIVKTNWSLYFLRIRARIPSQG